MRELHELPDDVLILIISNTDIDAVLSLRLTCANLCSVINAYIKSIAPAVARRTFPECDVLLMPPESGYSFKWMRDLMPAQLSSIALDKDKLRRHPYINSGFPYGIPSESDCEEAVHWREKIATGWRMLGSFYLISKHVHEQNEHGQRRPSTLRKMSGGMRGSRLWQAMSCPYPGCTEHGMKQIFDGRQQRGSDNSHRVRNEDSIETVRRRESDILEQRLALLERLSDQELLSYAYLWRLLIWTFRPYRRPGTKAEDVMDCLADTPRPNWSAIINDVPQGCSWLNWFILSVGPSPFLTQWSLTSNTVDQPKHNHLRDIIWQAYTTRTTHQIEVEREYVCRFEFALRQRCLSSERLKRLEAEIYRGRSIRTISLDCIPWAYDQHPIVSRPPSDFPWYTSGEWIWLGDEWCLQTRPGTTWAQPGMLKLSLTRCRGKQRGRSPDVSDSEEDREEAQGSRGPLADVPYLVYLGTEEASKVWARQDSDAPEFAF